MFFLIVLLIVIYHLTLCVGRGSETQSSSCAAKMGQRQSSCEDNNVHNVYMNAVTEAEGI